ncbi:MAG: aspartate aminotransferase family protein [Methanobacteriota archaeon]|nr:MAG: aspartate aminotransferase family protein [Euryarchaeota archaeon]
MDRRRIGTLQEKEEKRFVAENPKSNAMFKRAKKSLLAGVPMNWMVRWAGPFPVFVASAKGAHIEDVDGHQYIDFCLGDTGAMFGHSPKDVADAVKGRIDSGITTMLPTEDSIWVGEALAERFGLPYWQFVMTATDANRFSIRLAREVTGRSKILVFNGCYHGSVDEALIWIRDGKALPGPGNTGPAIDPAMTTRVVEFNDIPALEEALSHDDVACVLCEPAMTNIGIVLPQEGYHEALREITRRHGTLLIFDETHTICTGPGGYTREHQLTPDMITIGKPIAGGIPAAAYGISEEVAARVQAKVAETMKTNASDSGVGGTLSGNALAVTAMKANLEKVMTEEAYERMTAMAKRLERGINEVIRSRDLPWHVIRLGARVEYEFQPEPLRNGSEGQEVEDYELDRLMHLMALNRGILLTPFHYMALVSPETNEGDVDRYSEVFAECVDLLIGDG